MTPVTPQEILALTLAVSFAAGLNVYAVVATLGLLARADLVTLPASIALVEDWWVIAASLALYALEFVADKIPFFDLAWNVLQTFVRVPVAGLLAFAATNELSPAMQAMAAVGGSTAALVASSGKLALRGAVSSSPEPFTNVLLSLGEDVLAIGLTWFATQHPWLAAGVAVVAMVLVAVLVRVVWRLATAVVRGARRQIAGVSASKSGVP